MKTLRLKVDPAQLETVEAQQTLERAAQKLVDAAALLATEPMTLQLRYLQTLTEIGVEKNTTIIFPLPLEMMTLFNKLGMTATAKAEADKK